MLLLKTLHVCAAVLWLGNFAVTGIWALRAVAERNAELRGFAAREILFTDAVFTLCFGSAVVVTGLLLARTEHVAVLQTLWTRTALEIVAAAGVLWMGVLLPLEVKMYRAARAGLAIAKAFAYWNAVGWTLTLALFSVIYLMIARPV